MMESNFWKTKCFSFYECKKVGYLWFRLFNFKISFKHVNKYDFKGEKLEGFLLGHWLINIIK